MAKSQDNSNSNNVPVVEEIGGYITTKRAAELMLVELPSVGAIIHSGRVRACKIAGVILVEKASAIVFGKEREAQVLAETAKKLRSERLSKLSSLSDEALEQLMAKVEG